jgi:Family of unknown function (DUF6167)
MRRTVWFAAGAGAGVYALARARRAAETFTPDGLADRLAGWSLGLRLFGDEVRAGMADKENDVRQRLGVLSTGGSGPAALPAADTPPDTSHGTSTREGTH